MSKLSSDEFEEVNKAFIDAQNSKLEEVEETEHIDFVENLQKFVSEEENKADFENEIGNKVLTEELKTEKKSIGEVKEIDDASLTPESQTTDVGDVQGTEPEKSENQTIVSSEIETEPNNSTDDTLKSLDSLVLGNGKKTTDYKISDEMEEVVSPYANLKKAYKEDNSEEIAFRAKLDNPQPSNSHYTEHWDDQNNSKHRKRSKHGKHRKHSRFTTAQKVVIGILLAILAIIVVAVLVVFGMHQAGKKSVMAEDYGKTFDNTITYKGEKYAYNKDMTAIAVFGIDKKAFGLEDNLVGTAGQSDVNMVLALNTKTGKTSIIIVPRDAMVDIDKYSLNGEFMGTDKNQLCLAYAYGDGKQTSCKNAVVSLQRVLYGVPINSYLALNLEGVPALNDCIGGVTLTCTSDFLDKYTKGSQITLIGDDAREYIRARDEGITGDSERRERQIQYVKAYISKAAKEALKDTSVMKKIYDTGKNYAVTNITFSTGIYLGTLALSNSAEMLSFESVTSLKGKLSYSSDGYAQTILNDDYTLQTVLKTFYTKVS